MSVSSVEFIALVLLLAAVFFYSPGGRSRRALLAATNLGVLWWASLVAGAPASPWTVVALALFIGTGYGVAKLLLRRPSTLVLAGYLAALVLAFVWLKHYSFLEALIPRAWFAHPVSIIGLSYMLFRQIHFLVDVSQGQIEKPAFWTYLNYQINFTTLLAGPIQRHADFARDWHHASPIALTSMDALAQYQRIFFGVIKVAICAQIATHFYDSSYQALLLALGPDPGFTPTPLFYARHFLVMLYAYPMFVFFDFSGYCDIVIGAAALLGMRLPENFDRPYVSRNMIDFWTRQHMSLSFWIRDYLFTPMYKAMVSTWPAMATSAVFVCYFIAFLLAGIWHGSTSNFVIFGLLHGAGVSVVKVWEMLIIRRVGRKGLTRYLQIGWVRIVAIFVTLNFVSVAFIFFTPDAAQKLRMLGGVAHGLTGG